MGFNRNFTDPKRSFTVCFHSGSIAQFNNLIVRRIEEKIFIVIFSNVYSARLGIMSRGINNILHNRPTDVTFQKDNGNGKQHGGEMKKTIAFLIMVITFTLNNVVKAQIAQNVISKAFLVEDTRQLIKILEESHPDPYISFGGKIAFHRNFQQVLSLIPESGMTNKEYYNLLVPFIAKMCTMHTGLINPEKPGQNGPGIPLKFKIIDNDLVVVEVQSSDYKYLLGCKLESVNSIPIRTLLDRQTRLRGIENEPGKLVFLSLSLKTINGVKNLIPEWVGNEKITVGFRSKSGTIISRDFKIPYSNQGEPIAYSSKVIKPSTEKSDVVYDFLDDAKQNALLIISNMERYREASEGWFSKGFEGATEYSGTAYKHFNNSEPPTNREELLKGIPSVTETFISLIQDLKKNKTKNLIVDLRDNTGGNGIMNEMLIYFLFGKEGMLNTNQGYQITKYSDLYFQNYSSASLPLINKEREIKLTKDDYDFREEETYFKKVKDTLELYNYLKLAPTFYNVFQTKKYDIPQIQLKNIIILCNPFTSSSGFNLLTYLNEKGAKVLGTASAQPGNNFGDAIFFLLKNSGLKGYVSFKQNITFPDDPIKGKCLMPDYPLTYQKFMSFNFDPDAEILYALEIMGEKYKK